MRTLKRILGSLVAGAGLVAALSMTANAAPDFVRGTVDADGGLNGRIAPTTHSDVTYVYPDGSEVSIDCQTKGTIVNGNAVWYLLSGEGEAKWVSAEYVNLHGEEPNWCGDTGSTISVTLTQDVDSHQGPSVADDVRTAHHEGDGQEVLCYAYTSPAGQDRWVVTLEDGWLPYEAVSSDQEIPFCQ
ncbi:MAG TPA: hypothetical protein VK020_02760 [Microlunatus sp.]|nr:hypothetical protein [Microlunatus sp.]